MESSIHLHAERARLAERTLQWADSWWDEARGLVWAQAETDIAGAGVPSGRFHLVPPTGWYALGLLMRGAPGDGERAVRALRSLLALQYRAPGRAWHGTFARFAESPEPGDDAVMWDDYDPNWRQFVGTTFLLVLRHFEAELPADLVAGMRDSIRLAVEGEPLGRVPISYTNIILMKAVLEVEAGLLLGEPGWVESGEACAEAVRERFQRCGAFDEYNSPTYYGKDVYALSLWRTSGSARLREAGAELEAALWRDVARWYHAGLRNLCGPYTRCYGLDMTAHVGQFGLWIAGEVGLDAAPLPPLDPSAPHGHDLFFGPVIALVGTRLPDGALAALREFSGPRRVEQRVSQDGDRVATAWLGERSMAGAEQSDGDLSFWDQYVAAIVHWRVGEAEVGWAHLRAPGPSKAVAVPGGLDVEWPAGTSGDALLTVCAPGLEAASCSGSAWRLPGAVLRVETDASARPAEGRAGGRCVVAFERPVDAPARRFRIRVEC